MAPAIAACDLDRGFFLIEDFGPTLLFDVINDTNADALYADALAVLMLLQQCKAEPEILPPYSRERLREEMALFPEWFVGRLLNISLNDREKNVVEQFFTALELSAAEQPTVVVHRDYHSRNLVYRDAGPPGVIDFQDAVIGQFTYDLVSLLRDCYLHWPPAKVRNWADDYFSLAQKAGLCADVDKETFHRWFDWMGLQRHIKVLGIFARLSLRDHKHRYLNDLPLVIHYVLTVAREYEEFDALVEWFEFVLMPQVKKQPWWHSVDL